MRLVALRHWRTGTVGVVARATRQRRAGVGVACGGSCRWGRSRGLLMRVDGRLPSDGAHAMRGRGRGLCYNKREGMIVNMSSFMILCLN